VRILSLLEISAREFAIVRERANVEQTNPPLERGRTALSDLPIAVHLGEYSRGLMPLHLPSPLLFVRPLRRRYIKKRAIYGACIIAALSGSVSRGAGR